MNEKVKNSLLMVLGVLGGYAIMLVLSPSTTALIHWMWPETAGDNPPEFYIYIDVLYSTFYLVVGAYIAAWIARTITAPIILGTIFCIFGIIAISTGLDRIHPMWYQWFFIIIPIPAAWLGGRLRISRNLSGRKKTAAV